jgi:hypothetical protein
MHVSLKDLSQDEDDHDTKKNFPPETLLDETPVKEYSSSVI